MSELNENKKTVVSREGLKKLEDELQYKRTVGMAEIAEQLAVARGFGDLSENAEYDEAKNAQSRLAAEIAELENVIRNVVVIDSEDITTDKVGVGVSVVVEYVDEGDQEEYAIVGARESDPLHNRISNECPIGEALMGKSVGDIVVADAPDGAIRLKIIEIKR